MNVFVKNLYDNCSLKLVGDNIIVEIDEKKIEKEEFN